MTSFINWRAVSGAVEGEGSAARAVIPQLKAKDNITPVGTTRMLSLPFRNPDSTLQISDARLAKCT
jgi:hypothetical protein